MSDSFLRALGRYATKVYSSRGSRHCYAIMRVRIRRFSELSPCGREVRVVVRHKGFAALQVSVSASTSSEPAKLSRSGLAAQCHREFDVRLLAITVWAFLTSLSTTPAADFCCRIRVNYFTLSHESETCHRSPAISSTAFDSRPPDLPPASLMDTDCSTLPSDPTSR